MERDGRSTSPGRLVVAAGQLMAHVGDSCAQRGGGFRPVRLDCSRAPDMYTHAAYAGIYVQYAASHLYATVHIHTSTYAGHLPTQVKPGLDRRSERSDHCECPAGRLRGKHQALERPA